MVDRITKIDYRENEGFPPSSEGNIVAYYVNDKWWTKRDYIREINRANRTIYVGNTTTEVVVVSHPNGDYLRSVGNSTESDNLLSLPDQYSGLTF